MQSIRKIAPATLHWVQLDAVKPEFELRYGDELCGTLHWGKIFGSLASATSEDGEWTFKREGFLNPRVTIRQLGSDMNVGIFKPGWTGSGTLEFPSNHWFQWEHKDFRRLEWTFKEAGQELLRLRFESRYGAFPMKVSVDLTPLVKNSAESSLLASLGIYLLVLMRLDSATASGGTIPAAVC